MGVGVTIMPIFYWNKHFNTIVIKYEKYFNSESMGHILQPIRVILILPF